MDEIAFKHVKNWMQRQYPELDDKDLEEKVNSYLETYPEFIESDGAYDCDMCGT
jgi:hypothetical protein